MANNLLYKDIEINYCLLNTWNKTFVFFCIINDIVNCNSDYHKHLGYVTNNGEDDLEKDFYITETDIEIKKNYIHCGYIYSDINNK